MIKENLRKRSKNGSFLVCYVVSVWETLRRVKKFPHLSCDICEAGSCRSGVVGTWPCTKDAVICIHLDQAVCRLNCQHRGNTTLIAQSAIKHHEQANVVW